MRRIFTCCIALFTAACATAPGSQERRRSADTLVAAHEWDATTISAGIFSLAAWVPHRIAPASGLTIYIEGDGLAWLSSDTPSDDPTPVTPVALQLALAQPDGNAAYLARPCQYVSSANCEQRYWTSGRFTPEVVAAEDQAVERLKARFGAQQLTLVGYSGGGAIAALLAERRRDVVRLITVAGNLDHRAWSDYHHVTPLSGSMNPADNKMALANIRQWHFVGERDKIVPPFLVESFAAGMPTARVLVMNGYDHKCCWAENWQEIWKSIR